MIILGYSQFTLYSPNHQRSDSGIQSRAYRVPLQRNDFIRELPGLEEKDEDNQREDNIRIREGASA